MPLARARARRHTPRVRHPAVLLLALTLSLGCGRSTPAARVAEAFPERVGPFSARGAATEVEDRAGAYVRRYLANGREASLRVVSVRADARARRAFETALALREESSDEVARPVSVSGARGVLSWSRESLESSVEVVVADDLLLAFSVWPADAPDEAEQRFPASVIEAASEVTR
jgi:hypothetical protein